MKDKIKVYKSGHAFIGKRVTDTGYVGDVETLANSCTITLIKPDASLGEVRHSLEVVLMDIDLRIKQENRKNNDHKD